MGDRSIKGRGCVAKKFAAGGRVSADSCKPDDQGFFESGDAFKERLYNDKKACPAGAKVEPEGAAKGSGQGVDRIKAYRSGEVLDKRMKDAGV